MFHDPSKGGGNNSKQIQRDERSNNLTSSIINKQHNKEKRVFRPGLPNPWLQFIESSRRRQLVFALFRVSWRRLRRQRRPLSKKILTGWLLFEFRLVHLTNNFFICSPITSKSMGRPGHVKDRSPTVRVFALFRVSWRRLRRQRRPLSKKILTGWLLFEFRLVHLTNNFFIRPPIVLESMGRPRHM